MRKPRRTTDEPTFDPIQEELDAQIAMYDAIRLARPGMTQAKLDAEKARNSAKFDRRMAKARAKWDRMTILERKAWSDAYYREARRQRPNAKPAPAAELPLLYAISAIAERDRAKAEKAREAEKVAEVDPYAAHRKATGEEPRTPRATRPPAAPEAPAAPTEPPKPERPRRRRRGLPAVGPIGYQIDGVRYPPIYDEDDFE